MKYTWVLLYMKCNLLVFRIFLSFLFFLPPAHFLCFICGKNKWMYLFFCIISFYIASLFPRQLMLGMFLLYYIFEITLFSLIMIWIEGENRTVSKNITLFSDKQILGGIVTIAVNILRFLYYKNFIVNFTCLTPWWPVRYILSLRI